MSLKIEKGSLWCSMEDAIDWDDLAPKCSVKSAIYGGSCREKANWITTWTCGCFGYWCDSHKAMIPQMSLKFHCDVCVVSPIEIVSIERL